MTDINNTQDTALFDLNGPLVHIAHLDYASPKMGSIGMIAYEAHQANAVWEYEAILTEGYVDVHTIPVAPNTLKRMRDAGLEVAVFSTYRYEGIAAALEQTGLAKYVSVPPFSTFEHNLRSEPKYKKTRSGFL